MKKLVTLKNLVLLLIMSMTMTSCMDEDTAESMTLSGQWTGDFGMYYNYEYRGKIYTFNSYDTDIVFYPDYNYATHGYGYEIDYYYEGPYNEMSFKFFWEINRGVIYLDYPGNSEYNTKIFDYSLSGYYFTGYFSNGSEPFRLKKLTDFYDWNYYSGYGDYYYFDDPYWNWGSYWSKTRGEGNEEMTDSAVSNSGKIVGRGNRFTK